MKALKSITVSVLVVVMLFAMFACSIKGRGKGDEIDANYEWYSEGAINGTDVKDSSEISDYQGEHRINLVAWNTTVSGGEKQKTSSNDVVSEEIKRITGISVNSKDSFDN